MGSPARVADSHARFQWLRGNQSSQPSLDLSLPLSREDLLPGNQSQPRPVITAVLQPPQSINQDWSRFLFSDISNNAAHNSLYYALSAMALALFLVKRV